MLNPLKGKCIYSVLNYFFFYARGVYNWTALLCFLAIGNCWTPYTVIVYMIPHFSTLFHNAYSFPQYLHHLEVFSTIQLGCICGKIRLWKLWRLFLGFSIRLFPVNGFSGITLCLSLGRLWAWRCCYLMGRGLSLDVPTGGACTPGTTAHAGCYVFRFCCSSFMAFLYCSELVISLWRFMSFLLAMQR